MASRALRAAGTAVVVLSVASALGCSHQLTQKPSGPEAVFDSAVAKGDAAWSSGDAEKAFDLYTQALATRGATDTAGKVAIKQERAKHLLLARRILASNDPSPDSLGAYAQVVRYAAVDSTEAAAARKGLADSLEPYAAGVRGEVAGLRKSITTGRGASRPLTVSLVTGMAGGWLTAIATAPGATGKHAASAVRDLDSAARSVLAAFDTKYAQDALRDLASADKALDAADREVKAVRSGS